MLLILLWWVVFLISLGDKNYTLRRIFQFEHYSHVDLKVSCNWLKAGAGFYVRCACHLIAQVLPNQRCCVPNYLCSAVNWKFTTIEFLACYLGMAQLYFWKRLRPLVVASFCIQRPFWHQKQPRLWQKPRGSIYRDGELLREVVKPLSLLWTNENVSHSCRVHSLRGHLLGDPAPPLHARRPLQTAAASREPILGAAAVLHIQLQGDTRGRIIPKTAVQGTQNWPRFG